MDRESISLDFMYMKNVVIMFQLLSGRKILIFFSFFVLAVVKYMFYVFCEENRGGGLCIYLNEILSSLNL